MQVNHREKLPINLPPLIFTLSGYRHCKSSVLPKNMVQWPHQPSFKPRLPFPGSLTLTIGPPHLSTIILFDSKSCSFWGILCTHCRPIIPFNTVFPFSWCLPVVVFWQAFTWCSSCCYLLPCCTAQLTKILPSIRGMQMGWGWSVRFLLCCVFWLTLRMRSVR